MDEVQLFERVLSGTLGGMAVLSIVAWQLWIKLRDREQRCDEHIARFVEVTMQFRASVEDNTRAIDRLAERHSGEPPHRRPFSPVREAKE